jgi:serine/threonine protein kinase
MDYEMISPSEGQPAVCETEHSSSSSPAWPDEGFDRFAIQCGQRFGSHYTLEQKLGSGTSATVWSAHPNHPDAPYGNFPVAVKLFRAKSTSARQTRRICIDEVMVATRISRHPDSSGYLTQILGAGADFIVMKLEDGCVLSTYIEEKSCQSRNRSNYIGRGIFKALDFMHTVLHILHRDVKPQNIFVTPTGAKLGDFGLSVGIGEQCCRDYVQTRWYRAPEIVLQLPHGAAADVWAATCVVFELFTSAVLFGGKSESLQLSLILRLLGPLPDTMLPPASDGRSRDIRRIQAAVVERGPVTTLATRLQTHVQTLDPSVARSVDVLATLLDAGLQLTPPSRALARELAEHALFTTAE